LPADPEIDAEVDLCMGSDCESHKHHEKDYWAAALGEGPNYRSWSFRKTGAVSRTSITNRSKIGFRGQALVIVQKAHAQYLS
jgi:hypothetical protein